MLIIFEGHEGAGKTTMIRELKKLLPKALVCKRSSHMTWRSETSPYPWNWNLDQAALWDWRFFLEMMEPNLAQHHVFADRSFITQFVFQRALGPDQVTASHVAMQHAYEEHLLRLPHLVVFLENVDGISVQDDIRGLAENSAKIKLEYDRWLATTSLQPMRLQFSWNDRQELASKLAWRILNQENKTTCYVAND